MSARRAVLRSERYAQNAYTLSAMIDDGGTLVIEGQDLGDAPERFWGSREYEWRITIRAEEVGLLVAALGGVPGRDDPLDLLAARFATDERYAGRTFLEEHRVPFDFWSRVGD